MYRLYIDETGNADLKSSRDPNHRYLSLTGILMTIAHARDYLIPTLAQLKHDIFSPDPDEPIILHRKDIMQRNRPFHALRDNATAQAFDARLLNLITNCQFSAITVVIDKQEHLDRYQRWRHDPYHYCLEVLLERYVLWLNRLNSRGDVVGEVRGGKFDRRLEKAFTRLYERGSDFVRADVIQRCLTSNRIRLRPKSKNIAGLQLADSLAHPSALYVRSQNTGDVRISGFASQIVDVLKVAKYQRSRVGAIQGYGIKWLP